MAEGKRGNNSQSEGIKKYYKVADLGKCAFHMLVSGPLLLLHSVCVRVVGNTERGLLVQFDSPFRMRP